MPTAVARNSRVYKYLHMYIPGGEFVVCLCVLNGYNFIYQYIQRLLQINGWTDKSPASFVICPNCCEESLFCFNSTWPLNWDQGMWKMFKYFRSDFCFKVVRLKVLIIIGQKWQYLPEGNIQNIMFSKLYFLKFFEPRSGRPSIFFREKNLTTNLRINYIFYRKYIPILCTCVSPSCC